MDDILLIDIRINVFKIMWYVYTNNKNELVMAIKESKKLTPQELESLLELRSKVNNLTFQRGQLGLAEDNLELQKEILRKEFQTLSEEEQTVSNQLFKKYGKGEVNVEDGTITPVE